MRDELTTWQSIFFKNLCKSFIVLQIIPPDFSMDINMCFWHIFSPLIFVFLNTKHWSIPSFRLPKTCFPISRFNIRVDFLIYSIKSENMNGIDTPTVQLYNIARFLALKQVRSPFCPKLSLLIFIFQSSSGFYLDYVGTLRSCRVEVHFLT